MRKTETTFTCDRDGQQIKWTDVFDEGNLSEALTRAGWRVIDYGTPFLHGANSNPTLKSAGNMLVCRDCAGDIAEFLDKDDYKVWVRDESQDAGFVPNPDGFTMSEPSHSNES